MKFIILSWNLSNYHREWWAIFRFQTCNASSNSFSSVFDENFFKFLTFATDEKFYSYKEEILKMCSCFKIVLISYCCYNKSPQIQWLKNRTSLLSRSSSEISCNVLMSGWGQGCVPSGGSREEPAPFLARFLEVICTAWLGAPSSLFRECQSSLFLGCHCLLLTLTFLPLCHKDPCDSTEPIWIIKGELLPQDP